MKLGIIVDSSTGLTKKEVSSRGWGFVPLHVFLNEQDFADGIEITTEEVYQKLNLDTNVRTSASSPAEILELFEAMSSKYDHVIVYGLSKELSSQTSNLTLFSNDFENIHVINSLGLSQIIVSECERAQRLAKEGKEIEEIVESLRKNTKGYEALLIPHSLDWLVKGGRVNSTVATMASMLKIVPIIKFKDGKLDRHGKGRIFSKTLVKVTKEIIERFDGEEYDLYALHAGNKMIDEHINNLESITNKKIKKLFFPSTIALHVGLEAIGILAIYK
ncbi:DegV family protein [Mycoplasma marinum]|uniref:Fatty acid-binding protein DegV n=1 Tax=Mycoplasma marinum TaxID=1937190 RepID=A0A4V2NI70_9MOLU|nr:DegV family protein [Mycoplasma marinum]TCG11228.1 hypothetical protein C4B24_02610 [Mycoplasma marinum]